MKFRSMARVITGALAIGAMTVLSGTPVSADSSAATPASEGDPQFTTEGGVAPQFLANALTIPHWTFQFTDPTNGVTYPITMVGSDPRAGGSTTVHTVIIPLSLSFVAAGQDTSVLVNQGYIGFRPQLVNHTFDGSTKVSAVLDSPVYTANTYAGVLGGDTGQLGDVFMRAQFAKIGSSYHVNLVNDAVLPTQQLAVPSDKGIAYYRPAGALTGLADSTWFSTRLQSLMGSLQISADTVPVFLTDNVLLYSNGVYTHCCILGYHGAGMPIGNGAGSANGQGKQPVQTFMYSAFVTPGTYSGFLSDYTGTRTAPRPTRGLSDIHALSHEVSEWLDDPFVNNAVQPWKTPTAPQYGCTRLLETGDPIVGVWFGMAGNPQPKAYGQWHPEDEVFLRWFARGGAQAVGLDSWDGRNTFMGPLTTGLGGLYAGFGSYAKGC